jgi:hypothetical protein
MPSQCARCRRRVDRHEVTWPEGRFCKRCYQRATRIHAVCPGCQQQRLLPGLDALRQPICVDCAKIPRDFHCTRCGQEDDPYRTGLCARCCLRDHLAGMLDDGSGRVRPDLLPLYEAICTQPQPRSAIIWLRNPQVQQLLRGLAGGELPIAHDTFDHHPSPKTAMHLRELLVRYGVLEDKSRHLILFEQWLDQQLTCIQDPEQARLLRAFATWHHLRRMRKLASDGKLHNGSVQTAKQELTVAGHLLDFLAERGRSPATCCQADIDAWLASGPTTRSSARTFVRWSIRNRHMPKVDFPYRTARTRPILVEQERLDLLGALLDDDQRPLHLRVAAVLLLLYAQPLTRVVRLAVDRVSVNDDGVWITFDQDPVAVPEPFANLVRRYVDARPNMRTASNHASAWLFPGYRPGQPLHPDYLMRKLRDSGIHLLGGRNAAMRELVLEMPPAIVARAFGYSPQVTEDHAADAGRTWVTYASYRSLSRTSSGSSSDLTE